MAALAVLLVLAVAGPLCAAESSFFRIGTGGARGTYYPVGGLIAHAISVPPGARPCDQGGGCGVPGLIAVAQSANGSVANVEAVSGGHLESGFAQSNVIYWAYNGSEIFREAAPLSNIRVIASLYQESLHLVARRGAGISRISDLAGKMVSLDEAGSGTLVDARLLLEAHGLSEADLFPQYVKPNLAIERMRQGKLDAFFIVAGYPTDSVAELAMQADVELVPIVGPEVDALMRRYPFFSRHVIPAGTYQGMGDIETLGVGAQWVVAAEVDETLVYKITKALWNDTTRYLLDNGHAKARAIQLENALDGLSIPLHAGAERFYREAGVLK